MSTVEALLLFSGIVTGTLTIAYALITGYYRFRNWLWLRRATAGHQQWMFDNLDCERGDQRLLGACEEAVDAVGDIPDLTDEAREIPDAIVDEVIEESGLGRFAVRSDQVDSVIEKLKAEGALAEVEVKAGELPTVGIDSADDWWEIWEEPVSDKVEKLENKPSRVKKTSKKSKVKAKAKGKRKSRK